MTSPCLSRAMEAQTMVVALDRTPLFGPQMSQIAVPDELVALRRNNEWTLLH